MRLGVALRLGRVSNLPTTWSNVLAGIVLSGAALGPGGVAPALVATLLVAMSLAYVGGMYLNDAFDHRWDREHAPGRPIPAGEVSAGTVYALGFAMLGGAVALVAWRALWCGDGGHPPVVAAAALCGAIVLYDAFHKRNPLSPLLMGVCRVLVYLTAALSAGSATPPPLWLGAAALLGHLIGLTYAAKQEHLTSFRGGWPLLLLATPVLVAAFGALQQQSVVAGVLTVALAGWTLRCTRLLQPARRNVPGAITGLIAGISLVDAALVATRSPVMAAACIAAFLLTLRLQRVIAGT